MISDLRTLNYTIYSSVLKKVKMLASLNDFFERILANLFKDFWVIIP